MKIYLKHTFLLFLILFLLPASYAQQEGGEGPETAKQAPARGKDYHIGAEDVLFVSVWKNPDLTMDVPVRPDGMISFPLVDDIIVEGLTALELRDIITERLREYVTVLDVTVIIREINSYKAFILGEIRNPGVYEIRSNTTLLQLISMAGGMSEFASPNKIILLRMGNDNQERKIKVKLKDAMNGSDTSQNIILQPLDTVIVN